MEIEPEQESLLATLVEAVRNAPPDERHEFTFSRLDNADLIHGPGSVAPLLELQGSDLYVLRDAGLVGVIEHSRRGFTFYVTPQGFSRCEESKRQSGQPGTVLDVAQASAGVQGRISGSPGSPGTEGPIHAFVSWAHAHQGVDDQQWQRNVFRFAAELRRRGIDADIDLAHQHDDDIDWSTYGARAIERSDYVLLVASSAYKERWEGTGDPKKGPGAAREANVLKSLFDQDRHAFRKKVKVVLLSGVEITDIPTELQSSAQRFPITGYDLPHLNDLLRTLSGQPEWVMPAVGELPALPPKFVEGVEAANRAAPGGEGDDPERGIGDELRTRLEAVDREIVDAENLERRNDLSMERATIEGALQSLDTGRDETESVTSTTMTGSANDSDEDAEIVQHVEQANSAVEDARAAMARLPAVAREALFQQFFDGSPLVVSAWGEGRYSIEDAREAAEDGYLEQVDDEAPAFNARSQNRRVEAAEKALRHAREVLSHGGGPIDDWLMPALEAAYDVEDQGFGVRTTWEAFGFL